MIVTIHQPEHIPWIGFFNKAVNSDVFVLLDNVQYEKNYFQNRNNIIDISNKNRQLITVPVSKGKQSDLINEKLIKFTSKLKRKYFLNIEKQYKNYPYYNQTIRTIRSIFDDHMKLSDLNCDLITFFFNYLGIESKVIKSSEILDGVHTPGGGINYTLCKKLNASHYLSGISGKNYLDTKPFKNSNIKVIYQEFNHPVYTQPCSVFIDKLSIIDAIFSFSPDDCLSIIKSGYDVKKYL